MSETVEFKKKFCFGRAFDLRKECFCLEESCELVDECMHTKVKQQRRTIMGEQVSINKDDLERIINNLQISASKLFKLTQTLAGHQYPRDDVVLVLCTVEWTRMYLQKLAQ